MPRHIALKEGHQRRQRIVHSDDVREVRVRLASAVGQCERAGLRAAAATASSLIEEGPTSEAST